MKKSIANQSKHHPEVKALENICDTAADTKQTKDVCNPLKN